MKQKYSSFSLKIGLWLSAAAILVSASSPFNKLLAGDPGSNDFFDTPTVITSLPYTNPTTIDTTLYGGGEPNRDLPLTECGRLAGGHSAWFKYTAPSAPAPTLQSITIDTNGSHDQDPDTDIDHDTYDTMVAVYLYESGGLTEIGCDDDSGSGNKSSVNAALTADNIYYIVASSYNGAAVGDCDPCDPGGDLVLNVKYNGSLDGKNPPEVISANTVGPVTTGASVVKFIVTFSEDVTGVDKSDFGLVLTEGSISHALVDEVVGSGTTYTVSVITGIGNGKLQLYVRKNGTIINSYIYPLKAGFPGQTYTIERNTIFLPLLLK
jgi:hypothetical protein